MNLVSVDAKERSKDTYANTKLSSNNLYSLLLSISTWSKVLNELDQMGGGESETCKIMIRSHKIRSGVHMPPGFKVRGWCGEAGKVRFNQIMCSCTVPKIEP